jgi:integrase
MSSALAEALAQADDPEVIQQLLEAEITSDESSESTNDPQSTLSDLYQRYLNRRTDRSPATRAQYKRTIPTFVDFAADHDITHPQGITTTLIDEFADELFDTYDTDATIATYTKNVRAWLKWLHKRNLCDESTYTLLDKQELGLSPRARDEALPESEARQILSKLRTQRRGSELHAILELLWNTGLRIGEVRALDVSDYRPEVADVSIQHRSETGTRIKNGSAEDNHPGDGERLTELKPSVVKALNHYIRHQRHDVTDKYGREPLFTTRRGRPSRSTLRRWVYEATSCRWRENPDTGTRAMGRVTPVQTFAHTVTTLTRSAAAQL